MSELTPQDVDRIEVAAKAATPGEWLASHESDHDNPFWIVESADGWVCTLKDWFGATENQEADAKYIATMSPSQSLALVAALRAAWAENLALWEMMFRIALGANLPSAESIAVELVKRQSVNLPPKNSAPERSADDATERGG